MHSPTIYYICFIPPKTGGELMNVQAVASLQQLGWRVVALVNPDATTQDIPSDFPLERLAPGRQFHADDVVVIPEYYRDAFAHFVHQPCQRVIHTQGAFLTFRGFDSIEQMNHNGLRAGMACSRFVKQMMQDMGSTLDWHIVTPFVHPLFRQGNTPKKLQIAYMPDKRPKEAPVIYSLFRHLYPHYQHIPWRAITGVSRQACANILAESAIFASMSYLEGLGLPPLEAMASNCVVCGFTGGGGSDFATPQNGLWVAEGEWLSFAHALAQAVQHVQQGGHVLQQQLAAGQQTADYYAITRFEQELQSFWQNILGENWTNYLRKP